MRGDEAKGGKLDPTMFKDEVIYNVMDEEMTTRLWSRLETLYMMKSLSNKLYLKKQLYGLRMKEGTATLEHLNFSTR